MICQRWSHRTEEGKLLNWLEIRRALKALMFWHFLLSSPQCAFLTGDQLRNSEWWQSAARGEYTPLPFSSYSFTEWPRILIWISSGAQLHVCEGMQYLHSPVMSCPTLQAPSPGACLISFDFAGGRGGSWVWGSAPQWHFQLDQLAAISPFYLQKSQCHFGAVCLDPRTILMLVRSLKSETAGLPVPL